MPVQNCSLDGKSGYKWGDQGRCYTYDSNNESSKKTAKKKALAQGLAIGDIGKSEEMINGFPAATQDISVNIENRQKCIDIANYGPMNPLVSNDEYWQARADVFKTTIEEAKSSRCANCAAFIQTSHMIEAIVNGLGGEDEAYAVAKIANLGYCEIFDFKCAGIRTCDAWVVGGPVTDDNMEVEKNYDNIISILRDMLINKEK